MQPEILFEDNDIIVCRKPAGIAVQTASVSSPDMVSVLKNYLFMQSKNPVSGEPYLAVIHRLDQPVEGILVFGKTKKAAANLSSQIQNGRFQKYYQAITEGVPPKPEGTLCDYLIKDSRSNTSRVCSSDTSGSKKSSLSYRILNKKEEKGVSLSLLEISLHTGRHHQIRVQFANAGCPLLGDRKYNPSGIPVTNLALCACRLVFYHPVTKEKMQFETVPHFPFFY